MLFSVTARRVAMLAPGPLTNWGQEARRLWEHFHRPLDSWQVKIVDAALLAPPVMMRGMRLVAENTAGKLKPKQTMFFPTIDIQTGTLMATSHAGATSTLQDFLRGNGVDASASKSCFAGMWLPDPICARIAKGLWTELVLSCSFMNQKFFSVNAFAKRLPLPPREVFEILIQR